MPTLLMDSAPDALKAARSKAWSSDLLGVKLGALLCELWLILGLGFYLLEHPGLAVKPAIGIAFQVAALIFVPLAVWAIPSSFEKVELRLRALGGTEEDLAALRKSVVSVAELLFLMLYFVVFAFVSFD